MEVEKEQITGKLVFFGEFGVGKGLQFFSYFWQMLVVLSESERTVPRVASGFDSFFGGIGEGVMQGERVIAYFRLK